MAELISDYGLAPAVDFMFMYLFRDLQRAEQSMAQPEESGRLIHNLLDECVVDFITEHGKLSADQLTDFSDTERIALGSEVLKAYFHQEDEKRHLHASIESAQKTRRDIATISEELAGRWLTLRSTPGNPGSIVRFIDGECKDEVRQVTGTLADPEEFKSPVFRSSDPIVLRPVSLLERLRGVTYQAHLLGQNGDQLVSLSLA